MCMRAVDERRYNDDDIIHGKFDSWRKMTIPIERVIGAVIVAYPVSIGGYLLLRDEEMGSFGRRAMLIRTGICAAAYCLTWAIYAFLTGFIDMPDNPIMYAGIGIICLLLGGIAPWAALDFDYTNGLLHCGFYIIVCVALCFLMGAQDLLWVLPS